MPMMVGLVKPADEHPLRVETVEGMGLGITARHVALALQVVAAELVSIPQISNDQCHLWSTR
ncbi:MAG: hypothetical protein QOE30_4920, partial [Mycobacterium sp.]|nr:hypothetical protein [Mycobacterium sp.]